MKHSEKILKAVPKDKQAEAKQMVEGLTLPDIDVGALGKQVIVAVIDFVQANVLPKLTASNPTLGFAVSAVLETIEKALK